MSPIDEMSIDLERFLYSSRSPEAYLLRKNKQASYQQIKINTNIPWYYWLWSMNYSTNTDQWVVIIILRGSRLKTGKLLTNSCKWSTSRMLAFSEIRQLFLPYSTTDAETYCAPEWRKMMKEEDVRAEEEASNNHDVSHFHALSHQSGRAKYVFRKRYTRG